MVSAAADAVNRIAARGMVDRKRVFMLQHRHMDDLRGKRGMDCPGKTPDDPGRSSVAN
jgi:hypothetical protein